MRYLRSHLADLEKMSSLERISFLQEKLQDIRNHYLSLKSEVASIDRRRKRMKKKERESESMIPSILMFVCKVPLKFLVTTNSFQTHSLLNLVATIKS